MTFPQKPPPQHPCAHTCLHTCTLNPPPPLPLPHTYTPEGREQQLPAIHHCHSASVTHTRIPQHLHLLIPHTPATRSASAPIPWHYDVEPAGMLVVPKDEGCCRPFSPPLSTACLSHLSCSTPRITWLLHPIPPLHLQIPVPVAAVPQLQQPLLRLFV